MDITKGLALADLGGSLSQLQQVFLGAQAAMAASEKHLKELALQSAALSAVSEKHLKELALQSTAASAGLEKHLKEMTGAIDRTFRPFRDLGNFPPRLLGLEALSSTDYRLDLRMTEAMQRVSSTFAVLASNSDRWLDSMKSLSELSFEPRFAKEVAEGLALFSRDRLREFAEAPIAVDVAGGVSIAGDPLTEEGLAAGVESLATELAGATDAQEFIARLAASHSRQRPSVRSVLWMLFLHVLLPYFVSQAANLTTPDAARALGRSTSPAATQLAAMPQAPDQFRKVAAGHLLVRAAPTTSGKKVGTLSRGKLLRVVGRDHWWTFVEYWDEKTDRPCLGWVATAHITPLR